MRSWGTNTFGELYSGFLIFYQHVAVSIPDEEFAKFLLSKGANPNLREPSTGRTPLHLSIARRYSHVEQ